MEGVYDIYMGRDTIGKAAVERQGLYYRFCCRCRLSGSVIYRLTVSCGSRRESLGIPVPAGAEFVLDKKIAVKKLGKGPFRITAVPKHSEMSGKFVPIYPEEPFAYLTRLQDAFLEYRDGQAGAVIPEGREGSPV